MQVKMRTLVSGLRDGKPWPPVGGVLDVPDDEALNLLHNGTVVPVHDPERGVERAVAPDAERRDVVVESDGAVDTSARDALVPSTTKRTRERNR